MSKKAIQLNGEPVKRGHVLEVYNKKTKKFTNAKSKYYCIWV